MTRTKKLRAGSNLMLGNRYPTVIVHPKRFDSGLTFYLRLAGVACNISTDCGTRSPSRYRSIDQTLLVCTRG